MQQRAKQSEQKHTYTESAPAPPVSRASASASSADEDVIERDLSPFLTVLVTPKITFSLPRKPSWKVPDDIPQEELREAFLARFPLRIDASMLAFQCATPSLNLPSTERLVFRITSTTGGDDERVLLSILSSLDKAYSHKYEKQLEEARADLLSSSMSFQVVADEVRAGQQACNKRWEREVKSLKEQMSTNQKRLFLLEREKEGLQKANQTAEEGTERMRRSLTGLTAENASLKERTAELESQLAALQELVASQLGGTGGATMTRQLGDDAAQRTEVATQTVADGSGDAVEATKLLAMQQQLSAMGEWLRTGATLLENAKVQGQPNAAGSSSGGGAPHMKSAERLSSSSAEGGHEEVVGPPPDEPSSVC